MGRTDSSAVHHVLVPLRTEGDLTSWQARLPIKLVMFEPLEREARNPRPAFGDEPNVAVEQPDQICGADDDAANVRAD